MNADGDGRGICDEMREFYFVCPSVFSLLSPSRYLSFVLLCLAFVFASPSVCLYTRVPLYFILSICLLFSPVSDFIYCSVVSCVCSCISICLCLFIILFWPFICLLFSLSRIPSCLMSLLVSVCLSVYL